MSAQATAVKATSQPATDTYQLPAAEKRFIGLHVLFALIALGLGGIFGPFQAFEHARWGWAARLYEIISPVFKIVIPGTDSARRPDRPGIHHFLHHGILHPHRSVWA
ncbi:MAG: hypothetical protein ACUVS6_13060 [Anaerolineae bacterium]